MAMPLGVWYLRDGHKITKDTLKSVWMAEGPRPDCGVDRDWGPFGEMPACSQGRKEEKME